MFPAGERRVGESRRSRPGAPTDAQENAMFRTRSKTTSIVLVTLLALGAAAPGAARAAVLASGYLLSSNAVRLGCKIWNVGSVPITIKSAQVVLQTGYSATDFENCTGTLAANASCSVSGVGQLLAGIVRVDGGTKNLRGTCMLLTAGNNILESTEMR
jgi:hypothetical protein